MADPTPATPAGDNNNDNNKNEDENNNAGAGSEENREIEDNNEDNNEEEYMIQREEQHHNIQRINKEKSHSLEYLLEKRATADQLFQQNIMQGKLGIAHSIQQTQKVLRFQQTVDTLDQKLVNRPDKETLITNNIIRSKSADSLQARELKLNFQRTVDRLDHKLEIRPTPHQLQEQNIIKIGIAPSLYATQKQLQFTVTADSLDHKLENRPSRASLVANNIVKGGGVAASISAAQQELKFHTLADTLDHKLDHRPTKTHLIDQNILKEQTHPCIQGTQQTLKFNKTKSQVGHKMHMRPSKGTLVGQNILHEESPFLSETKKKLIRRRVKSSLTRHLQNRPSREEFDLRFPYYFTDSDGASSFSGNGSDTASVGGDSLDPSDSPNWSSGPVKRKSLPRAISLQDCKLREGMNNLNIGSDELEIIDEEEERDGEGEGEEREESKEGKSRAREIRGSRGLRSISDQGTNNNVYDHDYYNDIEEGYTEYYKSGDDDCSIFSSSV